MTRRGSKARKAPARRSGRAAVSVPFPALCRAVGLPEPVPEHRFHPERRWRFDWAWVPQRVALEQEGAVWVNGRHTRGAGVIKDMEKYNAAAVAGWKVLRATPQQIAAGDVLPMIAEALR